MTSYFLPNNTTSSYLPSRPSSMNASTFAAPQISNNQGNHNSPNTPAPSPYYLTVQAPQPLNAANGWNVPTDKRGGPTSPLGYSSQGNPGNGNVGLASPFNGSFPSQPSNGQLQEAKPVLPPRSVLEQNSPTSLAMNHSSPIVSSFSPALSQAQNDVSNIMVNNRSSTNRTVANTKRAAQNRAAQRAFRQRKDRYIKDLEQKAKELDNIKKQYDSLFKELQEKDATINNLKSQLARYKEIEYSDDDLRRNNNASPYSSSNNDDDTRAFDEEPWSRQKIVRNNSNGSGSNNNHHNDHTFFDKESNKNTYPFSPTSPDGSPPQASLNRPGSGLTENPPRGSGTILPPGPNADSTIDPYYRSEYRHSNHLNSSQNIAPIPILHQNGRNSYNHNNSANNNNGAGNHHHSNQNNGNHRVVVVPGEEDTDRVMVDDLCELLRTRSRPTTIPHTLGMSLWTPTNQGTQSGVNGNGTVVS
ncbi:13349_t:CDS:2 [Ambispora leptoticha]|uniref:13349_t:CDS:1 n=1 Tax=Ambispora leptoticha TaxID=144679 RepID=A0A9N9AAF5_9GLOM|nr:13349_t:CDS:2 [Ambispora leptoticha]